MSFSLSPKQEKRNGFQKFLILLEEGKQETSLIWKNFEASPRESEYPDCRLFFANCAFNICQGLMLILVCEVLRVNEYK